MINKRSLFLPCVLLLLAVAAGFLIYKIRGNVEVLTTRSLPAIRIIGDLRDTVSRLQLAVLEDQLRASGTSHEEMTAHRLQLAVALGLIQEYRDTAANPRDLELIEGVATAFEAYRARIETPRPEAGPLPEELLKAHHHLQHKLAELREYRLGRVSDRISSVERVALAMWRTNTVALAVIMLALVVTAFVAWARRVPDADPQNF